MLEALAMVTVQLLNFTGYGAMLQWATSLFDLDFREAFSLSKS